MERAGLCIGCGSCASPSPEVTMAFDTGGFLKPRGPREWRERRSAEFARTCPFSPSARDEDAIAAELFPGTLRDPAIGRYRATYVGAADPATRSAGSSGGMATWLAAELLRSGTVDGVAHVVPTPASSGRLFAYTVSRSVAAVRVGAKSRYYPIDLQSILREIREVPGRYAVVGIPCFIKAVQLARAEEPVLAERIVATIGLFCGHMKSARLATSFARQLGFAQAEVAAIDYRRKDPERPANWYTAEVCGPGGEARTRDWWHLAEGDWGAGFFMSPACNWCDDVAAECADVALGDAWLEPYSSDGRGTNVVVVRSARMAELIGQGMAEGRLELAAVDADFVRRTQAAGFRQRREGLGWRLARNWLPVIPRKRVAPDAAIPLRRRAIYALRMSISRWSVRVHRVAEQIGAPGLYYAWARAVSAVYHAFAYSRGRLGRVVDRVLPPAGE
jgi:coenzyme F420-reducing hydrogenase beta subunit